MRTRKSIINSSANIVSLILSLIPNFIVRKLFLIYLGSELLGLTSLYASIIGWLSLVELGIGSAIVYSLYKPFACNNYTKVSAYINFYKKFYKNVGITILIIGVIISLNIDKFISGDVDSNLAKYGFILFIIDTFISYMFSHKLCLLEVAQESYKITLAVTASKLLISIIQSVMLIINPNFIIYILVQVSINLIYFIGINIYILKKFKYIECENSDLEEEEKNKLLKNVKAMFMHKIGTLVVFSTDNIVISKFVGLSAVTKYTNYQLIVNACQRLMSSGLNGITASVGNLISEGNNERSYEVHKKVFFINFWISSFIVISLYNTLNQFVVLWVGRENLLDSFTFNIILVNLYFSMMRGSVEQFQAGSGNYYQDRYAPICEAVINLITSLILVKYIGLPGIFIGTLMSNFMVIFWTKPTVVYKYVFNRKVSDYFIMYFKYLCIGIIPFIITTILTSSIKYQYDIFSFIINCLINIIVINISYIIIFYNSEEYNYYLNIIKSMAKSA